MSHRFKSILSAASILPLLGILAASNSLGQDSVKPSLPDSAIEQFSWRSIGPANMGGRITSIAVYENSSIIATTYGSSSRNGGRPNWRITVNV